MRYELTDREWFAIGPMLRNKPRGVPRVNDRRVLNGIFWVLRSGAPWRDLPQEFGPYTTTRAFVRSSGHFAILDLGVHDEGLRGSTARPSTKGPVDTKRHVYRLCSASDRFQCQISEALRQKGTARHRTRELHDLHP